jgi:hypothetical protein
MQLTLLAINFEEAPKSTIFVFTVDLEPNRRLGNSIQRAAGGPHIAVKSVLGRASSDATIEAGA